MGKTVKSPPPRTSEITLESGSASWETMELESNPPATLSSDGVKPRPMERGGCPITTVTSTSPTRSLRTV